MRYYIIFFSDGSYKKSTTAPAEGVDFEILEGFDTTLLSTSAKKVYFALVNHFEYLFDYEWLVDFNTKPLEYIIDMLLNSYCDNIFFLESGLTFDEVYNYMQDELINEKITEGAYNSFISNLINTYMVNNKIICLK